MIAYIIINVLLTIIISTGISNLLAKHYFDEMLGLIEITRKNNEDLVKRTVDSKRKQWEQWSKR